MLSFPIMVPGSPWANGYLLWDDASGEAMVIDPDLTGGLLANTLAARGLKLTGILLTHGHFDHIASVGKLRELYPEAKIYIHALDADKLTDAEKNLSTWQGRVITAPAADVLLKDGDGILLGEETLRVLHTPGHTAGSVCYSVPGRLFSGDTLFSMSVGRWDFPDGDGAALIAGIHEKLMVLPDQTQVFPGHGPATSIGNERLGNPYLEMKV